MSTYSSNLRLELITTGTQAGTWGTTTNTNLGTLLEGAVSGYAVVTVTSTSQALTANNGAADESRLAMLQLTSSGISSAFSVFAPPSSKEYTIYNASSYTATIYNSTVLGNTTAAGTGVAIPAGFTMTVWSNGTSFFQQNTYSNAGTFNAPAITGVSSAPTASFGTNTTQLATTAFVQAALQLLHPVGSVYINATNNTNPGTLLGFGTWTAFGAGRVPVGFNAANPLFDTAEETGGSADAIVVSHDHTATSSSSFTGTAGNTGGESANHTHNFTIGRAFGASIPGSAGVGIGPYGFTNSNGYENTLGTGTISAGHSHGFTPSGSVSTSTSVASNGSSGTNANYQPYITVYMWKRTA